MVSQDARLFPIHSLWRMLRWWIIDLRHGHPKSAKEQPAVFVSLAHNPVDDTVGDIVKSVTWIVVFQLGHGVWLSRQHSYSKLGKLDTGLKLNVYISLHCKKRRFFAPITLKLNTIRHISTPSPSWPIQRSHTLFKLPDMITAVFAIRVADQKFATRVRLQVQRLRLKVVPIKLSI